jgi:hypothetical protein
VSLFSRLFGKRLPSDETIIRDYGAFIERHSPSPLRIEDVSSLPHPKDAILSAMLGAVVPGNDKRNDWLISGAIFLAQFQPGVGKEPLYQGGFDLTEKIQRPGAGDLQTLRAEAQAIVALGEKHKEQAKRFEDFHRLAEKDLTLMMARFEVASKKAKILNGIARTMLSQKSNRN